MKLKNSCPKILLVLIVLVACAKQMPPSGGPEDKIPPTIVDIFPKAGATNVPIQTNIEITFSERMLKKSVEDAIFFSPIPSEEIKYRWKNKKLKIQFGASFKPDRTYVMTIGSKSSDLRNNKMEASFSLAFSTGDIIDSGQISGTVFGKSKVEGTLVCAYAVSDTTEPDPATTLADYYTQCDQRGNYSLMYIAPGNYRLLAIEDKEADRKYNRGIDALGITTKDVCLTLAENTVKNINFQLALQDTTLLFLKAAYSNDRHKLDARFSEPFQLPEPFSPDDHFSIVAEQTPNDSLKILSCYQDSKDPSLVHLLTEPQAEKSYNLLAKKLFDNAGNGLDTSYNSALFDGSSQPDSMQPTIIFQSIADSARGIRVDSLFQIIFSEPIRREPFERNFSFAEKEKGPVSGKLVWANPAAVSFVPDKILKYSTAYQINVAVDSVRDQFDNSLKDSMLAVYFRTMAEDTLSAISGTIADNKVGAVGKIYLRATSEKNHYSINIDVPGPYSFEDILPGIYTIYAFRDEDGNGQYSHGKLSPFVPAERFIFYADSIKVRSNWPNEGENLILEP